MTDYYNVKYCAVTRGISDVVYTELIAVVIAYFSAKGYKLSSELLTHMYKNNTLNSSYTPTYGSRIKSSSVFKSIANGKSTSGSAAFPNSGTTTTKDLYYAIHNFNYTKSSASSKTVKISDRYDYSSGDYSGVAIGVMKAAQDAGVLVPFYTKITETLS